MTDFKRRTLILTSGKQIKLFGNSVAIGKSLEIGEGYAPNVFSAPPEQEPGSKNEAPVSNPYKLTPDELMDLADFNIQLWMDLKANIRRYGIDSPKMFTREARD